MRDNFHNIYVFITYAVSILIFLSIFLYQIKVWIASILPTFKIRKKILLPSRALVFSKWSLYIILKGLICSACFGVGIFAMGKILESVLIQNKYIIQSFVAFPLAIIWLTVSFIYFRESAIPVTTKNQSGGHEKAFMLFLNVLLPSVKEELKILAGGLCPHFYGDNEIIARLVYLKEKGVNIILLALDPDKIITEGGKQEHVEIVKKEVIEKFKAAGLIENLVFLSKRPSGSQFIIIDGKTLRLEDPHPPWWSDKLRIFRATLYLNKPFLARYYEQKFDELLQKAETSAVLT